MNTERPIIQRAAASDAAALAGLGKKAFTEAFARLNNKDDFQSYVESSFTEDRFRSELLDKESIFFIAKVSGQWAGYAKLSTGPSPECVQPLPAIELSRLYALKPYWGCGIGPALMETCIAHARSSGFKAIWLGSWKKNNRGNAFYRKKGFTIAGSTTFTLGSDIQEDHVLVKSLGRA
ncbi:MAG: GNAT family N-acetyltransferase [Desulfobacterales bacterium]|nr:GNAT family N-acetyltransferase [Desulfobacterales bacterium]